MDKGPWLVEPGCTHVSSDDFKRDVWLKVTGDFDGPDDLRAYCEWLVDVLNKASAKERGDRP